MPSRLLPLLILFVVAGCSRGGGNAAPVSDGGLRKVTLQLNWYPEAEHGGFYTALVNGYYREAGLDVTIIPGGADVPVVPKVASGQADFGIENADRILMLRSQEADVLALLAPMQTSPRCLVVHESTGAKSFGDLGGFTIAMSAGEPFAEFLMKGQLPADVKIVPFTGGVSHFLRDAKHAQQGYSFSEPFVAREQGGDPRVLLVAEAGFNPYTSCLFTSTGFADGNAEVTRKMVAASLRGWKEYFANPEPTNAEIHRINPEMSLEILAFGVEAMRPLCFPEGEENEPFGRMTADRWQTLAKQMTDIGVLEPGSADPAKAFRTDFLPAE